MNNVPKSHSIWQRGSLATVQHSCLPQNLKNNPIFKIFCNTAIVGIEIRTHNIPFLRRTRSPLCQKRAKLIDAFCIYIIHKIYRLQNRYMDKVSMAKKLIEIHQFIKGLRMACSKNHPIVDTHSATNLKASSINK